MSSVYTTPPFSLSDLVTGENVTWLQSFLIVINVDIAASVFQDKIRLALSKSRLFPQMTKRNFTNSTNK